MNLTPKINKNFTRVAFFSKILLILSRNKCYNVVKSIIQPEGKVFYLNALLTIDPNTILICALIAIIAVLAIMLLVEKGKTKKAQARASRLSADARRKEAEELGLCGKSV